MKIIFFFLLLNFSFNLFAQDVEKIEIPKGIVYKYCDANVFEKAKQIVAKELSDSVEYTLDKGIMFIGPVLWSRYDKVDKLHKIKGGNMTILGYKKETSTGKMTQSKDDFKLVWNVLRDETKAGFKLRKATVNELKYYWSVISFDIEEPLIIIETAEHNFILNLSSKDFKIVWLDEAPIK